MAEALQDLRDIAQLKYDMASAPVGTAKRPKHRHTPGSEQRLL